MKKLRFCLIYGCMILMFWLHPSVGQAAGKGDFLLTEERSVPVTGTDHLPSSEKERAEAARLAIEELVSGWEKEASRFQRIRTIYTWICENVTYDITLADEAYTMGEEEIYFAVVEKRALCGGFARLFERLAAEMDLEALYVTGQAEGYHAWNLVKLGDYWYSCDPTRDR